MKLYKKFTGSEGVQFYDIRGCQNYHFSPWNLSCISAFHICINSSDMILRVWITDRIYSKSSLLFLNFIGICVIAFHISIRISIFLFIGCLSESIVDKNISSSFESEVIARSMMHDSTSENKEKYGYSKFYGCKIKLTWSKRLFCLSINYCNMFEKSESPLKYFMFLKNGIRWFTW